jgi:hypothetical protein
MINQATWKRELCKYCGCKYPSIFIEDGWWHEICYRIWQETVIEDERVGAELAERELSQ